MPFLYALICLALIYLLFCFAPAVVMFRAVFFIKRHNKSAHTREYYLPHAEVLKEAVAKLTAIPAQELSLTAHDGVCLKADYYNGGFDKTAVLIHGYRATAMENCAFLGSKLMERGYNILLVHQRAHGKSGGCFTTMGLYEQYDAIAWIDRAAAMDGIRSVVAGGVSLGATALAMASDKIKNVKLRAMLLDCGFCSLSGQLAEDCKKLHIPRFMVLYLVELFYRLRFRANPRVSAEDSLHKTDIPAVFLHGTSDVSVPPSDGQRNYEACASEKEALFVPQAEHTCALLVGGDEALEKLYSFLERHCN